MADSAAVKCALARLATEASTDRAVIESAAAGVADIESAAAFVDDVGIAHLAMAIERQRRAGETKYVAQGERALAAFRRYRTAAARVSSTTDHFHPGRTTDLGTAEEEMSK